MSSIVRRYKCVSVCGRLFRLRCASVMASNFALVEFVLR